MKINFKNFFLLSFFTLSASFAEDTYVNQFKLFNDFDKFLPAKATHYEVFPDGNAEFYANSKYSNIPSNYKDEDYKDTPEFVLKDGRLYHKDKLICDIKDGYPVPVNEERPDNLTEMQKEMTICIYLPFVYYKKDYSNRYKKNLGDGELNYSIRVILDSWFDTNSIIYKGKSYYQRSYIFNDRDSSNYISVRPFLEENKKCRDKFFSDEKFVQFYEEVISCGLKKNLDCLKKLFGPAVGTDNRKASFEYGKLNPETDNDLLFLPHRGVTNLYSKENEFTKPYSELRKKLINKELHRIMLVDNINKLVKHLSTADYVCFDDKKYNSLSFIFKDIEFEVISFYKDSNGGYKLGYSAKDFTPDQLKK